MQNFGLHKKLYQIKGIDEREYSKEVYERKEKIEIYEKLRSEGCSESTALMAIKTSRATFFRWQKKYRNDGLFGLENDSRRPNNVRQPRWDKETEQRVLIMRKQYPLWGKHKISAIIKRYYNKEIPASTVGRILKRFLQRGLIRPVAALYGKKETKRRLFNGYAQRWQHGMKATKLGELIQIDHMVVTLDSGMQIKHFKAVCPISKLTVEQAYTRATSNTAAAFLNSVKQQLPFPLSSIQVDGGSEFMAEFEKSCESHNIALFVLPPRSPEYNGCVERGNGTVKYEFYYQYEGPPTLSVVQKKLQKFVIFYNTVRPHQSLKYLTPWQYYSQLTNEARKSHM